MPRDVSNPGAAHRRMKKADLVKTIARLQRDRLSADVDYKRALHELETYQQELELQNYELRETQRLLEQSRDRYARLYDSAPVGYLSLDHMGRIYNVNLTACTLLGIDRARLVGQPLLSYVAPEERRHFFSHLRACRRGDAPVVTEIKLASSSESGAREVEMTSVSPSGEEAREVLCHSAMTDITERRRAQRALAESEAKFRWLVENLPVAVWSLERDGSLRYVSPNIAKLLGYAEDEVHAGGSRFWFDNIHPDDRGSVKAAYDRLFNEAVRAANRMFDLEYRRRTKDGGWVWVLDKVMFVSEDDGHHQYANGVFWDISLRKRMESELQESESRFRQLAENINEVFYLASADSHELYYVSPASEKVWGLPPRALYENPRAWQQFIHPGDRAHLDAMLGAGSGSEPYDVEFRINANGALRWIRARGFPIRDEKGRPYRVAGIAEDITLRRNAEAAQAEASQRLREFTSHLEAAREEERARISREIHDELGALLLAAKIDLDACRKQYGASHAALAQTMESLMERIDTGIEAVRNISTALRPSVLDNVGVLAALEWQANEIAGRTGIRCKVLSNKADEELKLDPERATAVFRIVQEALTNVVRHSGARRVQIALRAQAQGLHLQIKDDGKGFDPSRPPDFQHWGLIGMAERARALGGEFRVESTPKRGTAVRVFLPNAPPGGRTPS